MKRIAKILCFFGLHDYEATADVTYDQPTKKYTHIFYNECKRCKKRIKVNELKRNKYQKYVARGIPITKTAVNCLLCGKKLRRARGQVIYFCCKAHRKIYRGGKDNKKKYGGLKEFVNEKGAEDAKNVQEKKEVLNIVGKT